MTAPRGSRLRRGHVRIAQALVLGLALLFSCVEGELVGRGERRAYRWEAAPLRASLARGRHSAPGRNTPATGGAQRRSVGPAHARTLKVYPDGRGDTPTLAAAVAALRDGDTLHLAAGTYREPLLLVGERAGQGPWLRNVSIEGEPGARLVIENSEAEPAVIRVSGVEGLRLSGLTAAHAEPNDCSVAVVEVLASSRVVLEDLLIKDSCHSGLAVIKSRDVEVRRARLLGALGVGVVVRASQDVSLHQLIVAGNRTGVELSHSKGVELTWSSFAENGTDLKIKPRDREVKLQNNLFGSYKLGVNSNVLTTHPHSHDNLRVDPDRVYASAYALDLHPRRGPPVFDSRGKLLAGALDAAALSALPCPLHLEIDFPYYPLGWSSSGAFAAVVPPSEVFSEDSVVPGEILLHRPGKAPVGVEPWEKEKRWEEMAAFSKDPLRVWARLQPEVARVLEKYDIKCGPVGTVEVFDPPPTLNASINSGLGESNDSVISLTDSNKDVLGTTPNVDLGPVEESWHRLVSPQVLRSPDGRHRAVVVGQRQVLSVEVGGP